MAIRIDATGDKLTRTASLPPIANFSVLLWFYSTASTGTWATFVKFGLTTSNPAYWMGLSSTGVNWYINNGTTTWLGPALTTGTWTHMAITVAGTGAGQFLGYLNGALNQTGNGAAGMTAQTLYLGNDDANENVNGRLANVHVYNAALSASEIAAQMRQYQPVRPDVLNAWYPLWSPTQAGDASGAGRSLTQAGTLTAEDGPPIPWTVKPPTLRRPRVFLPSRTRTSAGSASVLTARVASALRTSPVNAGGTSTRAIGPQIPALLAHTSAASSDTFSVTTTAINTTGATLLVVAVASYELSDLGTVVDTRGNTWHPLTPYAISADPRVQLYYAASPLVSTSHTFGYTWFGSGAGTYSALCAAAFSGVLLASPLDVETGAASGAGSTLAPGALTPSQAGVLLVSALAQGAGSTATCGAGFAVTDQVPYSSGVNYGITLAWKTQTSLTPSNPSWTVDFTMNLAAAQADFFAAPAPLTLTRTLLASLQVSRQASVAVARAGSAQTALARLVSASRTSAATATHTATRASSALASRLLQTSATRSALASAQTLRSAGATGSPGGVMSAAQTLTTQTLALALLGVTHQEALRAVQAQDVVSHVVSLRRGSTGVSHATPTSVRSQARLSPGQALAVRTGVSSATSLTLATATGLATGLANAQHDGSAAALGHGLPQVLAAALMQTGVAVGLSFPGASAVQNLQGAALTDVVTVVSARLVAQGLDVATAQGLAAATLTRLLVARTLVRTSNAEALTLLGSAVGVSSPVAHARRTLLVEAQDTLARLVANVTTLAGRAHAVSLLAPIVSDALARSTIAMARVTVQGRFWVGGELHIVGPGNRRLQTLYPQRRVQIYRYPLRRH